jgi:hypothetical protein|tara:strand:- start:79 stop:207 length:129 start_codon:yes stop_codon:yes gene_type:complete
MYELIRQGYGWEDCLIIFKPKDVEAFRKLYLQRFKQEMKYER